MLTCSCKNTDLRAFRALLDTNLWSTFAVASSITKMRLCLRIARARHTSCRWPTLKFEPDSASSWSSLFGNSSTACFSWTCRKQTTFYAHLSKLQQLSFQGKHFCYLLQHIPQFSVLMLSKWVQIFPHGTTKQHGFLQKLTAHYLWAQISKIR